MDIHDPVVASNSNDLTLLMTALGSSMFVMGCEVSHSNFTWQVRHPKGMWIGIVVIYCLMPLTGAVLSACLSVTPADAVALITITSCPIDGLSSIFTFWTHSDVSLSLSITILSTVLAIGSIPFGIIFFSRGWSDDVNATPKIPDVLLIKIMALLLITVGLGMGVRKLSEKWAGRIAKVASPLPLVMILASVILRGIFNPASFQGNWKPWIVGTLIPLLGFIYGYVLGFLAQEPAVSCRALAFASADKSFMLAAEIIKSFEPEVSDASVALSGPSQLMFVAEGLFFVLVYKSVIYCYA